jgi:hypothetical protein
MGDQENYDPTWRDDAELDALLLRAKLATLKSLDKAMDYDAGLQSIKTQGRPPQAT